MQYDRNDEITYDEGFTTSSKSEYYNKDKDTEDFEPEKEKKRKSFPSVLFFQIIICVLCGLFLYFSKAYSPNLYNTVMDKVNSLINDSLVVEGNDINEYFVTENE